MPKFPRRLVIDLDGTLCTTVQNCEYGTAQPIQPAIDKVNGLKENGWEVIIHTARGMNTFSGDVVAVEKIYRHMTEDWLDRNKVRYDRLVFGKPAGDVYVDDKGLSISDFLAPVI